MNSVRVTPGDIVFGDLDGVCIVPRAAEHDVFRLALEKTRDEQRVAKAIRGGMSAVEAFKTFGIM
jgi:regulator of RNase E activity RraA